MIYKETGGIFPKKYEIKKTYGRFRGESFPDGVVVWVHNVGVAKYGGLVAPKFKLGRYSNVEDAKKAIDQKLETDKRNGIGVK